MTIELNEIKKRVIMAMFSDDYLMDLLVLKGGNALDIIHRVISRSSFDFDFSIADEIKEEDIPTIKDKIERVLRNTFREVDYEAFDVTFEQRPPEISVDMKAFWGGYRIEFKIIEAQKYAELSEDLDKLRRNATVTGPQNKRRIGIDISKFEYCSPKQEAELDGLTVYVYSPVMIVCEKLRAICQQMPEYLAIVKSSSGSARARDFFDIYTTMEFFNIDLTTPEILELLKNMFAIKKVPMVLLAKIPDYRDYHKQDFPAVENTVIPGTELKDFDFYFDYLIEKSQSLLKPLGVI
jgi:hypothetical protein